MHDIYDSVHIYQVYPFSIDIRAQMSTVDLHPFFDLRSMTKMRNVMIICS